MSAAANPKIRRNPHEDHIQGCMSYLLFPSKLQDVKEMPVLLVNLPFRNCNTRVQKSITTES